MWSSTPGWPTKALIRARTLVDAMPRQLILAFLLLAAPRCFGAEEIEPLDAEFLEYLSQLENDQDDWTLIADAESATDATSKAAARRAARKAARQAQQQEAAKPAADER